LFIDFIGKESKLAAMKRQVEVISNNPGGKDSNANA
jgi:hypothetical protein